MYFWSLDSEFLDSEVRFQCVLTNQILICLGWLSWYLDRQSCRPTYWPHRTLATAGCTEGHGSQFGWKELMLDAAITNTKQRHDEKCFIIEWILSSLSCIDFMRFLSTYLLLLLAKLCSFPQEKYGAVLVLSLDMYWRSWRVRIGIFRHLEIGMSRSWDRYTYAPQVRATLVWKPCFSRSWTRAFRLVSWETKVLAFVRWLEWHPPRWPGAAGRAVSKNLTTKDIFDFGLPETFNKTW